MPHIPATIPPYLHAHEVTESIEGLHAVAARAGEVFAACRNVVALRDAFDGLGAALLSVRSYLCTADAHVAAYGVIADTYRARRAAILATREG